MNRTRIHQKINTCKEVIEVDHRVSNGVEQGVDGRDHGLVLSEDTEIGHEVGHVEGKFTLENTSHRDLVPHLYLITQIMQGIDDEVREQEGLGHLVREGEEASTADPKV